MTDLDIHNSQETKKSPEITSSDVPAIVVHSEVNNDIIQHDDDPPPYSDHPITEDPEKYYDTTSAVVEFNAQSFLDNTLLNLEGGNDGGDLTEFNEDPIEETLEEEDLLAGITLSPLERLLKFSKSKMVLQRLVVTKEISSTIHEIDLLDAVEKVLPVIALLGKDTDDSVKEALAGELDKIIYFYYQNAPPLMDGVSNNLTSQIHIPRNAFATTVIEFLLDQNTTLASIAQQSIVNVASELADTPKDSDKYTLHQSLLHYEIYRGIILGLMDIVNSENKEQNDGQQSLDEEMDLGVLDSLQPTSTTAVVEKVPANKSNNSEISAIISSATSAVLKQYDDGGINLAKMVCLMLISALAQVFGPEGCADKFLPIVEGMVSDQMFYVRKEAAAAVGSLSTAVTPAVTLERLLPLYSKLSVDSIWHVRRSCVFALPLLCEVLPEDVKVTTAVEGFELFKNDVSRNVRNSLADITGEVISKFLPDDWKETRNSGKVPEELLEFFLSLGNPSSSSNQMFKMDTERIHNCAFNYPAIVLTAGVAYWDSHLKDTYLNLTKDYQLKVRRTFAYSLHEIARIIGPERTERDLVQIFALYLMDLDDVKQGVLDNLSEFLSVLAVSSRNEYIPILAEVWDGVMSNWHLRNTLAHQLRDIAGLFDASRVVEHILPLAIRACHDEFAAIRETGVEIFPVILDIVKKTVDEDGENLSQIEDENDSSDLAERQQKYAIALLNHVMEKIDDLVRSSSYRTRLVFTSICRSLLEAGISSADFASFFLPRLASLSKDPVVNIRIAVSRTMKVLCSTANFYHELSSINYSDETLEDELNPEQMLDSILYHLSTDTDGDVRGYIEESIAPDRLQEYRKRREEENVEEAKALEIAENDNSIDDLSAVFSTLPPPPSLPAHLVLPSDQQIYNLNLDEDVVNEDGMGVHTILPVVPEENEEDDCEVIYDSTESPMDIVDDYDDVEDMSLSVDQIKSNTYEDANGDQVIPYIDIHDTVDAQSTEEKQEDETMMDMDLAGMEDSYEDQEVSEKAKHVYLSKVSAHVISNDKNDIPSSYIAGSIPSIIDERSKSEINRD